MVLRRGQQQSTAVAFPGGRGHGSGCVGSGHIHSAGAGSERDGQAAGATSAEQPRQVGGGDLVPLEELIAGSAIVAAPPVTFAADEAPVEPPPPVELH